MGAPPVDDPRHTSERVPSRLNAAAREFIHVRLHVHTVADFINYAVSSTPLVISAT
jgi:hypothetical protein